MTAAAAPAADVNSSSTGRVLRSATALVARSAWERALALVTTLVIARLLVPRDFGIAALVLTTVALATTLVDAGLTISLVRAPQTPSHETFVVARRIQFALGSGVMLLAIGVAALWPTIGWLIALDALQLLIDPFVLTPKVLLQRSLEFAGLAAADAAGVLCRALSSLLLAVAWPGPTALVVGDVIAAYVTAILIIFRYGKHAQRPERQLLSPRPTELLRRSVGFQGFSLVLALRDLSTSALIGGLVGIRALGLWQFAYRAMSPVFVIFTSLNQLAVPVGARVVSGARRPLQQVREGYLVAGLLTAVILATAAAPAHWAVPLVFGTKWAAAVPLVAAMALALVVSGPASTFGVGIILAADRARLATGAAVACAALFLGTLAALSSFGGVGACAAACVSSAVVETAVVLVVCKKVLHVDLVFVTVLPVPVFLAAYTAGAYAGTITSGAVTCSVVAATTALLVSGVAATAISMSAATAFTRSSLQRLTGRPVPKVA